MRGDFFSFLGTFNQLKQSHCLYSDDGQGIMLSKLFQCFEDRLYFLPSFVVAFLELEEILSIILAFVISDRDSYMELLL